MYIVLSLSSLPNSDTAYTPLAIDLHTDNNYFAEATGKMNHATVHHTSRAVELRGGGGGLLGL